MKTHTLLFITLVTTSLLTLSNLRAEAADSRTETTDPKTEAADPKTETTDPKTETANPKAACTNPTEHTVLFGVKVDDERGDYCTGTGTQCLGARRKMSDFGKEVVLESGLYRIVMAGTETVLWEGDGKGYPSIWACPDDLIELRQYLWTKDASNAMTDENGNIAYVSSYPVPVTTGDVWLLWNLSSGPNSSSISQYALAYLTLNESWTRLKAWDSTGKIVAGWPTPFLRVVPRNITNNTSFAEFYDNRINLHLTDVATSTLAHEMAHIAEMAIAKASGHPIKEGAVNYGYLGSSGHSWDTLEYKHAAYTEGLANFWQAVQVWTYGAPSAKITGGLGPTTWGFDVEANSCSGSSGSRKTGQITRFLWDLADYHSDSPDNIDLTTSQTFFDVIERFPAGVADHQINEPFDTPELIPMWFDFDGRSIEDHIYHLRGASSASVRQLAQLHCLIVTPPTHVQPPLIQYNYYLQE